MATTAQLMDFTNYLGYMADRAFEIYENTSKYNDEREDVYDAKCDAIKNALEYAWFGGDSARVSFIINKRYALRMKEAHRQAGNYHDYTYYRIYAAYIYKFMRMYDMKCN